MRAIINVKTKSEFSELADLLDLWDFDVVKVSDNDQHRDCVEPLLAIMPEDERRDLEPKLIAHFTDNNQAGTSTKGLIFRKKRNFYAFRIMDQDTGRLMKSSELLVQCLVDGVRRRLVLGMPPLKLKAVDLNGKKDSDIKISRRAELKGDILFREKEQKSVIVRGHITVRSAFQTFFSSKWGAVTWLVMLIFLIWLGHHVTSLTGEYPDLFVYETEAAFEKTDYNNYPFMKLDGPSLLFFKGFMERIHSALTVVEILAAPGILFSFFQKKSRSLISWNLGV